MKTALIQMKVGPDKEANLKTAGHLVRQAGENGARIVVLPEMFCCPYDNRCFPAYAEPKGGRVYTALGQMAKSAGVTLVGGSFPERDGDLLYNTCFVFDPEGREIARHRKAHLFDIDVEGGQRFHESEVFTPGDRVTVFSAEGHIFGLAICFDIRFAELFRCMSLAGAEAIFVPAAFNMTTGPMHWELSFRMRAVDNQLFTLGCAPARDEAASYVSYANSIVCSPWGRVLEGAGTEETVLYAELDLEETRRVRAQLPILSALRPELYERGVGPVIREIRPSDDRAVEGVIRSCLIEFGAAHDGTAWADPDLGRFSRIYRTEGNRYWVAEDEAGEIVGGVGIGRLSGADDLCELQKMYCLPRARGTGIAHRLMDTALEYAGKYYRRCYLETLPNMTAAQRFYEKYGFVRVADPPVKTEHFACDVRYLKTL